MRYASRDWEESSVRQRTSLVLVIAHQFSTIAHADSIVPIRDGEVRWPGTYEALIARLNGRYRSSLL